MTFQEVLEQYHSAADAFARGNAGPVKKLFSHRDDVLLANPFGPAVLGWDKVSVALDFASSRFRDGRVIDFQTVATYATPEMITIYEIEHWKTKVGERASLALFELRVTTTFRLEDGEWKIAHRHADPIASEHPDGPLRGMNGQSYAEER